MEKNEKLRNFDPVLYDKIQRDFDRNEIRGDEVYVLEDWIAKMLVAEGLLGLLRKDLIEINGVAIGDDDQLEPTFKQTEELIEFQKNGGKI